MMNTTETIELMAVVDRLKAAKKAAQEANYAAGDAERELVRQLVRAGHIDLLRPAPHALRAVQYMHDDERNGRTIAPKVSKDSRPTALLRKQAE